MTIAIPRLDRTTAAERGLTLADFLVPISVGERLNARLRHILLIASGASAEAATGSRNGPAPATITRLTSQSPSWVRKAAWAMGVPSPSTTSTVARMSAGSILRAAVTAASRSGLPGPA